MSVISANEIKTRGVAAIEVALQSASEAVISVRGKDRFVVLDMAHYQYLRECELEAALVQSRADVAAGRVVLESVEAHLARLDAINTAA
jgi:PHD/YefM family antitoxin component YafN of YafNO toxin-antitoxin module